MEDNSNDDDTSNNTLKYIFTVVAFIIASYYYSIGGKKNKYSVRPKVTLKCRFFNFMLWPYHRFQLRKEFQPLDLSKLKKYAMKKTGLKDFGGKFHETSFEFAVRIANHSCYSAVGYAALQDFLKRLLVTRLRIVNEINENPKMKTFISENPIRKPIFIVGLPRTGTTFLHRLLSLDPENTAPVTWELMDPVPRLKNDLDKDAKKRIQYCKTNIDMLLSLIPHFAEVHEMGSETAEECTVLMGVDAPALVFNFHTLLPEQDEIFSWNWTEAYENYYKGLQIIQHYRGLRNGKTENRRLVLKAPPHLGVLDHLTNAFPDARIIWNHRNPKECLPSLASLIRAGQDICEGSGYIQLDEIGAHMVTYAKNMYERGDAFFDSMEKSSSYCGSHVMYKDLIKDPIGTVKKLYSEFGYEFTDTYKAKLEEYLVEDKKKRDATKGSRDKLHQYTLEEYGLSDSDIDVKFDWYMKKYLTKGFKV